MISPAANFVLGGGSGGGGGDEIERIKCQACRFWQVESEAPAHCRIERSHKFFYRLD